MCPALLQPSSALGQRPRASPSKPPRESAALGKMGERTPLSVLLPWPAGPERNLQAWVLCAFTAPCIQPLGALPKAAIGSDGNHEIPLKVGLKKPQDGFLKPRGFSEDRSGASPQQDKSTFLLRLCTPDSVSLVPLLLVEEAVEVCPVLKLSKAEVCLTLPENFWPGGGGHRPTCFCLFCF